MYLGKLRSISTKEYILYDNGVCRAPDDINDDDDDDDDDETADGQAQAKDGSMKSTAEKDAKSSSNSRNNNQEASLYRKELAVIYFNTKARPGKH